MGRPLDATFVVGVNIGVSSPGARNINLERMSHKSSFFKMQMLQDEEDFKSFQVQEIIGCLSLEQSFLSMLPRLYNHQAWIG